MRVLEGVSLTELTTFKVGGLAQVVVECENEEDVKAALALARERGLPWYVLGGGSNVLANDAGFAGVIVLMKIPDVDFETDGNETTATVGAGVVWDEFVRLCTSRGLWGVENLAGIPGSVGAAPVQNIGAYGMELGDCVEWVETFDVRSGAERRSARFECNFGYRDSLFKRDSSLIIVRVALKLASNGTPRIDYADIARRVSEGEVLDTPEAVANVVRDIRSYKFPDLQKEGTAGSFFKNPIISNAAHETLKEKYPELPGFPIGTNNTKISLAWILDNVFNMRGFTLGHARLFERQPLVLVAEPGATSAEIDELAHYVENQVREITGIVLEREVRMLD